MADLVPDLASGSAAAPAPLDAAAAAAAAAASPSKADGVPVNPAGPVRPSPPQTQPLGSLEELLRWAPFLDPSDAFSRCYLPALQRRPEEGAAVAPARGTALHSSSSNNTGSSSSNISSGNISSSSSRGGNVRAQAGSLASEATEGTKEADTGPVTTTLGSGSSKRLLVCHDMKGGYVEDRWPQGTGCRSIYRIWDWPCVDTFVYFSHSLVTIPPPAWTNSCHLQGVKVLGTFITEWDEGAKICAEMLASPSTALHCARQLATIAAFYNFDGWLFNIENKVDPKDIPALIELLRALTAAMHAANPDSVVLWYDSVTVEGALAWQDRLDGLNEPFFRACDGIFTNYSWGEGSRAPQESAGVAGPGRAGDVLMGVDTWQVPGRHGKGFRSGEVVGIALREGVSAALFAPAWVYETQQPPGFEAASRRLWGPIWDAVEQHGGGADTGANRNRKGEQTLTLDGTYSRVGEGKNGASEGEEGGLEQGLGVGGSGGTGSSAGVDGPAGMMPRGGKRGGCRTQVQALPFFSSFDQGVGAGIWLGGTQVAQGDWGNLSCQTVQPHPRALRMAPAPAARSEPSQQPLDEGQLGAASATEGDINSSVVEGGSAQSRLDPAASDLAPSTPVSLSDPAPEEQGPRKTGAAPEQGLSGPPGLLQEASEHSSPVPSRETSSPPWAHWHAAVTSSRAFEGGASLRVHCPLLPPSDPRTPFGVGDPCRGSPLSLGSGDVGAAVGGLVFPSLLPLFTADLTLPVLPTAPLQRSSTGEGPSQAQGPQEGLGQGQGQGHMDTQSMGTGSALHVSYSVSALQPGADLGLVLVFDLGDRAAGTDAPRTAENDGPGPMSGIQSNEKAVSPALPQGRLLRVLLAPPHAQQSLGPKLVPAPTRESLAPWPPAPLGTVCARGVLGCTEGEAKAVAAGAMEPLGLAWLPSVAGGRGMESLLGNKTASVSAGAEAEAGCSGEWVVREAVLRPAAGARLVRIELAPLPAPAAASILRVPLSASHPPDSTDTGVNTDSTVANQGASSSSPSLSPSTSLPHGFPSLQPAIHAGPTTAAAPSPPFDSTEQREEEAPCCLLGHVRLAAASEAQCLGAKPRLLVHLGSPFWEVTALAGDALGPLSLTMRVSWSAAGDAAAWADVPASAAATPGAGPKAALPGNPTAAAAAAAAACDSECAAPVCAACKGALNASFPGENGAGWSCGPSPGGCLGCAHRWLGVHQPSDPCTGCCFHRFDIFAVFEPGAPSQFPPHVLEGTADGVEIESRASSKVERTSGPSLADGDAAASTAAAASAVTGSIPGAACAGKAAAAPGQAVAPGVVLLWLGVSFCPGFHLEALQVPAGVASLRVLVQPRMLCGARKPLDQCPRSASMPVPGDLMGDA